LLLHSILFFVGLDPVSLRSLENRAGLSKQARDPIPETFLYRINFRCVPRRLTDGDSRNSDKRLNSYAFPCDSKFGGTRYTFSSILPEHLVSPVHSEWMHTSFFCQKNP